MGVRFYDDALLSKLRKWTAGTEVMITNVNETKRLFEVISDTKNDNPIKLPLIALSRVGGYVILNKNKKPLTYNGSKMIQGPQRGVTLNAIPIGISYQIDVYTKYLEEADEYIRNLVFNIINYPTLNIEIPYENQKLHHNSNIRLVDDVEDNSDIPERLIPGQFTRMTLGINIDDAYLWDVRIKNDISIELVGVTTDSITKLEPISTNDI